MPGAEMGEGNCYVLKYQSIRVKQGFLNRVRGHDDLHQQAAQAFHDLQPKPFTNTHTLLRPPAVNKQTDKLELSGA